MAMRALKIGAWIAGGLIGLIWGFFHGLIGGALFAWFYNRLIS
jgi:hypothetical protein